MEKITKREAKALLGILLPVHYDKYHDSWINFSMKDMMNFQRSCNHDWDCLDGHTYCWKCGLSKKEWSKLK